MTHAVHPKHRVAVDAACLSPLYGLPLLGPWGRRTFYRQEPFIG